MKRLFAAIAILIFAVSLNAMAQLPRFKAKEGLPTAIQAAKDEGMENPLLVMVGTMTETINFQGMDINIYFDLETGTSNMWAYLFKAEDSEQLLFFGVVKFGVIYFAIPTDPTEIITNNYALDPTKAIGDAQWMDSPEMADRLKATPELISFLEDHPEPDMVMVMLFYNSLLEDLPKDEVFWAYQVNDEEVSKSCAVNSVSGDVICSSITKVETLISADRISAYPNPAESVVTIDLNENFELSRDNIELFDSFGREITGKVNISVYGFKLMIDVVSLSPGVYYAKLKSGRNAIFAPVVRK